MAIKIAAIKIASAKSKGRALQQAVCALIRKAFPQLEDDDVRSCPMGSNGLDVLLSPAAQRLFPYAVEAKARKSIAAYTWLTQAMGKGRTPLLFMKADRKPMLVTMFATDFFELLARADRDKYEK